MLCRRASPLWPEHVCLESLHSAPAALLVRACGAPMHHCMNCACRYGSCAALQGHSSGTTCHALGGKAAVVCIPRAAAAATNCISLRTSRQASQPGKSAAAPPLCYVALPAGCWPCYSLLPCP